MKKLLALLLLFGIVGCSSKPFYTNDDGVKIYTEDNLETEAFLKSEYGLLLSPKALAKPIRSLTLWDNVYYAAGEYLVFTDQSQINQYTLTKCEKSFSERCLIAMEGNKIVWQTNLQKYKENEKEENEAKDEAKRITLINALKKRCVSYGFSGDSNIAACIQREAQHDKEIAMQKLELQKTNASDVEAEEELSWVVKFLGDVTKGVIKGLADPQNQNNKQQQEEINRLKKACKRSNSC